jgi:hypothetical protein
MVVNKAYKLPIFRVCLEVFQSIKSKMTSFMRVGLLPYIMYFIIVAILIGYFKQLTGWILLIMMSVSIVPPVMGLVGVHRIFLTNKKDTIQIKTFRWSRREINYCLNLFEILILNLIITSIIYAILENVFSSSAAVARSVLDENEVWFKMPLSLWYIVTLLFGGYFVSRWLLILPATSMGKKLKFSEAWFLSKGNGVRLTFLITIIPFISALVFEFIPVLDSKIYSLFITLFSLAVTVFEIGLISLSYQYLLSNVSINK